MRLQPDNDFALLAHFLSPFKNERSIEALRSLIRQGGVNWGQLLYRANTHLCTPLWYVRLREDALLSELPEELQEYLFHLHQANIERNLEMKAGLEELLGAMQGEGIEAVLLKGGATFCDDLYADPGARVMADLDILVQAQAVERSRQIMVDLGYLEVENPGREPEGLATDERHHHINCHVKPGTPVAVEIHYKVAYSQAGRVCPVDIVWPRRRGTHLGAIATNVLCPHDRLLHNAVHALVSEGDYIRSQVSLRQLAEFAALVERYGDEIDWDSWQRDGQRQRVGTELSVYRALAQQIMGAPGGESSPLHGVHLKRFLAKGDVGNPESSNRTAKDGLLPFFTQKAIKAYYYAKLPLWSWNNVFYAQGQGALPDRLRSIRKKLTSSRSLGNIPFE